MGRLLFVGTFGTDDPTRASMPFVSASGALDAGHEPLVFLIGEAVYLTQEGMVDKIHGVGVAPLRDLITKMVDHGVPIYI